MAARKLSATVRRIAKQPVIVLIMTVGMVSMPAAAAYNTLECDLPPNLKTLMDLLRARVPLLVRVGVPVVAVLLTAVGRVAAQEEKKVDCPELPPQLRAINDLLNQIQSYGFALALGLAAVMITYAGLLYMSGDPANQEKARRIIVNTVIGLLIVGLAGALVELVKMQICPGGG